MTHGVGAVLSVVGSFALMSGLSSASLLLWLGGLAYSLSLVGVYVTSTLSHLYSQTSYQRIFRQLDQAFIYLLIVSSYTPFSLAFLKGPWWWGLLIVMWILAIAGFVSKLVFAHKVQTVSIGLYLVLGWLPALGGMPWSDALPPGCISWIIYGGVAYSVGTVFLFNDKRVLYFHAVWHLFVMAGSAIHFGAILHFVVDP